MITVLAFIWFFAGVNPFMSIEECLSRGSIHTETAGKGFSV